jgi:hypothetical protein
MEGNLMNKIITVLIGLVLVFALAGCASQATAQANAGSGAPAQSSANGGLGNTLEAKLAVGTLKLEGTGLAVTPEEGQQLLPLWQKVKTLSADSASSAADLKTTYQQIEKVMTPDQVQWIKDMTLTQANLQALMTKYGIQITPGASPNGANFATPNADQLATRTARETQNPGGGFAPGGTLSPDQQATLTARETQNPGGGFNQGGTLSPDQQATRTARETQSPGGGFTGRSNFSNQAFIDALIQELQQSTGG